ncbi:MAG: histidinol-phosphatase HisJ family protein [Candidatus Cloacimonetes bacterium]|nr:histidinol-phosphatase HisJ family protein [Candidatus Cloacimonadota bacterium]
MLKTDLHIHSFYSTDSKINPDELIEKAIKGNYDAIGITDHFDIIASELSTHNVITFENYCNIMDKLKAKYPQIRLIQGAEVGEYHWFKAEMDKIFSFRVPEFIIASIHFLSDRFNISVQFEPMLTDEQQRDYYKLNLDMVEEAEFDVLGHLGIFKRYTVHDSSCCVDLMKDIFRTIIAKGIALEINYSGYNKPVNRLIPYPEEIALYAEMGGKLISIGSDSHQLVHFDSQHKRALQEIENLIPDYKIFLPKETR